jgi:acetoin utilization deacetylase AcuC-like enzyme
MLPFKLIYDSGYDLNFGSHVFPSQKYRLIRDRLLATGFATDQDFERPEPASDKQVLLAHDRDWVERLKSGRLTYAELARLEIPWKEQTIRAFWLATGGTTLAGRKAIRDRVGFNIGGGFHHAYRAHGEGFCAINDIAVAIRTLQHEGVIQRAMVVDCDVHHGNGTASIFAGDPTVATLSIHQFENYPSDKPPSTLDIHLPDATGDEDYLSKLREGCTRLFGEFRADLVFYVAGADPYESDQLGGLALTMDGLKRRDTFVIRTAVVHHIPVAITLAGGYARNVEDTVAIHCNTAQVVRDVLNQSSGEQPHEKS